MSSSVDRHLNRVSATIARGKRPVPSRTRKLSLSAPMVLRGPLRGRVGRRRTQLRNKGRSGYSERPLLHFSRRDESTVARARGDGKGNADSPGERALGARRSARTGGKPVGGRRAVGGLGGDGPRSDRGSARRRADGPRAGADRTGQGADRSAERRTGRTGEGVDSRAAGQRGAGRRGQSEAAVPRTSGRGVPRQRRANERDAARVDRAEWARPKPGSQLRRNAAHGSSSHGSAGRGRPSLRSGEPARDPTEPPVHEDVDVRLLDPSVRAELKTLSKPNGQAVAGHLVAAGQLLDVDPGRAVEHARAARNRAARVAAVREAVGVAAYHAEEWAEALSELRTT